MTDLTPHDLDAAGDLADAAAHLSRRLDGARVAARRRRLLALVAAAVLPLAVGAYLAFLALTVRRYASPEVLVELAVASVEPTLEVEVGRVGERLIAEAPRVMDRAEAAILDAPPRVVAGARDLLARRFDRHLADLEGHAYTIVSALLDASLERARAEGIDLDDDAQLASLVDDSGPVMRAELERVVHELYDEYRLAADGVGALVDRLSSGDPLSPEDERRREILVSGLALIRKLESDPGRAPLQGLLRGEAPRP